MLSEHRPLWTHIPQLPLGERDRRWSAVHQKMKEAGLDCLLVWGTGRGEHLRYISLLGVRGVALVLSQRDPVVFTDGLVPAQYVRYCHNWVEEVRQDIENLPSALRNYGLDGATIGVVTSKSPQTRLPGEGGLPLAGWIQGALPRAKLVDATRLPVYLTQGFIPASFMAGIGALTVVAFFGAWLGRRLIQRISAGRFKQLVSVMLLLMGVKLVADGFRGLP
jgi:hypothetical protein